MWRVKVKCLSIRRTWYNSLMVLPTVPHRFFLGTPLTGKTRHLMAEWQAFPTDRRPLFLSFYEANAALVRKSLTDASGESPAHITTMQRFITRLLSEFSREADLSNNPEPISAVARTILIRKAWASVRGPLWRRYRETPNSVEEVTRVIDWLSFNRDRFTVSEDELSDHELSRVYARFLALCGEHRLLTFQEATLRALSLLAKKSVEAEIIRNLPTLFIDDLHQARPDQLAFLERLCTAGVTLVGTAWTQDRHSDPALRRVWETITRLSGEVTWLSEVPSAVNPAIHVTLGRLSKMDHTDVAQTVHPVTLFTAETAEEETQAITRSIVTALRSDSELQPEDILVIAADATLLGFVARNLERAAIPVAALHSDRLNPYIVVSLWIVAWRTLGPNKELLEKLLRHPLLGLDLLDLHRVEVAARELKVMTLDLDDADYPDTLCYPAETAQTLSRLRRALKGQDRLDPPAKWIEATMLNLTANRLLLWEPETDRSWQVAFDAWLRRIEALQNTLKEIEIPRRELLRALDQLVDQQEESDTLSGVRLSDANSVEGLRARHAYVIGLSESVIPRQEPAFQLIGESDLATLFADNRPVCLPALRDNAAWIERETRHLSVWLSRSPERLSLSVSRHSASGQEQLPTPYFERLLGEDGEIDREGRLLVNPASPIWRRVQATQAVPGGGFLDESSPPPTVASLVPTPERTTRSARYSASQIRTYLRCPLQFYYDKVLHLDSDETPGMMRRGTLLHLALCVALGNGETASVDLRSAPRPAWLDDAELLTQRGISALDAAWKGERVDLPGGGTYAPEAAWEPLFGPSLQRDAVRLSSEQAVRLWADFEVNGRADRAHRRPILLEIPFSLTIGSYTVNGRIDRIDEIETQAQQVYDLIDYKTGSAGADSLAAQIRKFFPDSEETQPTDYQLPIYALALQNGVHGINATPQTLTYINLDRLSKTGKGGFAVESARSVILTESDQMDTRKGMLPVSLLNGPIYKRLMDTIEQLSHTPYPATPGYHCTYCGFRSACSRGQAYGE